MNLQSIFTNRFKWFVFSLLLCAGVSESFAAPRIHTAGAEKYLVHSPSSKLSLLELEEMVFFVKTGDSVFTQTHDRDRTEWYVTETFWKMNRAHGSLLKEFTLRRLAAPEEYKTVSVSVSYLEKLTFDAFWALPVLGAGALCYGAYKICKGRLL